VQLNLLGRKKLAAQLGNPHGLFGRFVARMLNTANRSLINTAVDSLGLRPAATAVDVGFGGGIGLKVLLDAVGDDGRVHGVDQSDLAVAKARRIYGTAIAAGRVIVHQASMTALPLESDSIDGAVSTNTVYFLSDDALAAALAEFARVLTPTGRLALGVSDPGAMERNPLVAHGFTNRSIATLESAAAEVGLRLATHLRSGSAASSPHVLVFEKA
jgi:ubiquinone/menaquinone biosynthesis C-methylase UbiE